MSAIIIVLLPALLGFGLGDLVDVLESDELGSAVSVTESFIGASREITDTEEYFIGRSVAANILDIYTPLDSPGLQNYVNIAGSTVACFSPRPSIYSGYHFMILDSDDINALACPGGYIFVCRGLLDLADNEDEMACILAHELAHVCLKHGLNSVSKARWTSAFTTLGTETASHLGSSELQEATENYGEVVEEISMNLITKGYSRDSEKQADSLAVYIAAAAGYDPNAMISVLQKMSLLTNRSGPGFWQTHPSPEDRIQVVQETISEAGFPAISPEGINVRSERFHTFMSGTAETPTDERGSRGETSTGTSRDSGSSTGEDTSSSERGGGRQ